MEREIKTISQHRETPVIYKKSTNTAYRYAYARSSDSQAHSDPGQDYLTLADDDNSLIFALCDGVSQSFYGDLAAKILGNALIYWLDKDVGYTFDPNLIAAKLNEYLNKLTGSASNVVANHPISADLPEMLRSVLEEKRLKGSESTFVCGRLDWPGPEFPNGRAVFAWLGDSRLRIWDKNSERTRDLPGVFETMQRWSTVHGSVGSQVHVYVSPLKGDKSLSRILVYSDGLSDLDKNLDIISNNQIQTLIDQAGLSPTSDDISFLEIFVERVPDSVINAQENLAPRVQPTVVFSPLAVDAELYQNAGTQRRPDQASVNAPPFKLPNDIEIQTAFVTVYPKNNKNPNKPNLRIWFTGIISIFLVFIITYGITFSYSKYVKPYMHNLTFVKSTISDITHAK